jgi:hypothetical protein
MKLTFWYKIRRMASPNGLDVGSEIDQFVIYQLINLNFVKILIY